MSVSFGFSKTVGKSLVVKPEFGRKFDNIAKNEEIDGDFEQEDRKPVTLISEKSWLDLMNSKNQNEKRLIIPLIVENQWRQLPQESAGLWDEVDKDREAKAALLQDALDLKDDKHKLDSPRTVPLLFANRVPSGFETDEKLDPSLRPDEPTEEDYDSVPVDSFGLAVLRGMGWSEGDPIGKSNKKSVAPTIPELRPKGLGLGADRSLASNFQIGKKGRKESNSKDEDGKILKIGSFVKVVRGPHRETYGKVESMDEDNARLMVRLALGGNIVTVSQYGISLVTQKEYERDAKCINKSQYDRYKDISLKKGVQKDEGDLDSVSREKSRKKAKKRQRSRSPKSEFHPTTKKKPVVSESESVSYPWIRADLRVRVIDKQYKNGKYYKEKVITVDASSSDDCICKDGKGRILEGLNQEMLETVIPKSERHFVMILRGRHRGEVGSIMEKDMKNCKAVVQLLRHQDSLEELDFDDICEYVGDISAYE